METCGNTGSNNYSTIVKFLKYRLIFFFGDLTAFLCHFDVTNYSLGYISL